VKKTITALLCAASLITTTPALAGSLSDPVVAPEVIVEETIQSSSSEKLHGLLAALTIVLIIVGKGA